ncbi:MAG TPA: hypothetical protein PKD09_02075 [Aggregatilinea sp.]|uniref:hypothetical protein n=1 Tax=Aggregatilinea sp. TaxID=2806333 RepID=UPI002BA974CA|nr:hypothetical protein [Aggregatilinea sp.]HML20405.1 hypothetical protein [Aggregatilinea sp.]
MRDIFRDDFTFTKRHLGVMLCAAGPVLIAAMLAAEWLDADSGGFGLVQRLGVVLGAAALVLGLSLIPLGNQPA